MGNGARGWGLCDLGLSALPRQVGGDAGPCPRGQDRLATAQQDASSGKEGAASFAATGRAYVRFALANPANFRLIFTPSVQLQATGDVEALRMLRANAAAASPGDAGPDQSENGALRAWSLVHGLAMLMPDSQLPADNRLIDKLIQG